MAPEPLDLEGYPCRFCAAPVTQVVCDLGMSPLCESFLRPAELDADGALLSACTRWSASSASWSSCRST